MIILVLSTSAIANPLNKGVSLTPSQQTLLVAMTVMDYADTRVANINGMYLPVMNVSGRYYFAIQQNGSIHLERTTIVGNYSIREYALMVIKNPNLSSRIRNTSAKMRFEGNVKCRHEAFIAAIAAAPYGITKIERGKLRIRRENHAEAIISTKVGTQYLSYKDGKVYVGKKDVLGGRAYKASEKQTPIEYIDHVIESAQYVLSLGGRGANEKVIRLANGELEFIRNIGG